MYVCKKGHKTPSSWRIGTARCRECRIATSLKSNFKYRNSELGKLKKKQYNSSDRYKEVKRKYLRSEHGKNVSKRWHRIQTLSGDAAKRSLRNYYSRMQENPNYAMDCYRRQERNNLLAGRRRTEYGWVGPTMTQLKEMGLWRGERIAEVVGID